MNALTWFALGATFGAGMALFAWFVCVYRPPGNATQKDPALWGRLLEKMLQAGDVHLEFDNDDSELICAWFREDLDIAGGFSSAKLPGEAVYRCWLSGMGGAINDMGNLRSEHDSSVGSDQP